ncbi:MAG: hypothetical protein LAN71_02020 [Acidobacteriia bacterium]|nr:hypothetical protein [Terriglobia bacterium]
MKSIVGTLFLSLAGIFLSCSLALARPAPAQTLNEPAWPHKFEVLPGETSTSGFIVSHPGPIVVTADWQGAPLIVTLHGPLAKPMVQNASGHVQLTYQVSPDDVKKSHLWAVSFAPQGNPPKPGFGRAAPLATGTLTVRHPPADSGQALPQLRDMEMRFHQQRAMAKQSALAKEPFASNKLSPAGAGSPSPAAPDPQKLSRLQAKSSVPVRLVKDFSPASLAAARGEMITKGGPPPSPKNFSPASIAAARGEMITKDAPAAPPAPPPSAPPLTIIPMTGAMHAQKGEAMMMPQPQIDPQSSHTDRVMVCCEWHPPYGALYPVWSVAGANFGNTPGELHFVINGQDTAIPVFDWSRDGISVAFMTPHIFVAQQTDVQIYVKTAGGFASNRVTFHYAPVAPQITGILYSIMGNPNLIDLIGTFFGDAPGEIHFVDANGNDAMGTVTSWASYAEHPGDTFVLVSPSLAYFQSGFDGTVYARVRGVNTSRVPVHFDPAPIVTIALPVDHAGLAAPLDNQYWPVITHSSDFFIGHKGDDQFFAGKTLKNGWVVDSVAVIDSTVPGIWWGNVGLYLSKTPAKGSTDPSTTVHWYADASCNSAQYQLVVNIRGPQGAPYW